MHFNLFLRVLAYESEKKITYRFFLNKAKISGKLPLVIISKNPQFWELNILPRFYTFKRFAGWDLKV